MSESAATAASVSVTDEMIDRARAVLREAGVELVNYPDVRRFTRAQVDAGELRRADREADAHADGIVRRALEAALGVDANSGDSAPASVPLEVGESWTATYGARAREVTVRRIESHSQGVGGGVTELVVYCSVAP